MPPGTFSLIGAGRAGRAIARLTRRAGWRPRSVCSRTLRTARSARDFIGGGRAVTSPLRAAADADLIVLGVPDGAIGSVWREILPNVRRGAVAFHLCGNESSRILRPSGGARVGSIHPMRSFADPALAVRNFKGTWCGVEGPVLLEKLVRAWGGVPLRIRPGAKALYHAAAVFSTNYLIASADAGVELLVRCKVPRRQAIEAVASMASGAAQNLETIGLPGALTGPIERGDVATVARHVAALEKADGRLLELYAELARRTCRVARSKGTPRARLRQIERLLDSLS